jgi:flagellar protein FliS
MKANSSHTAYKQQDAACSQPQLILMIYDAAIRFTREAAAHLAAGRWAEKGQAVESAYECIAELRRALNLKEGGEVAVSLDRMYDFLSTKLALGNAGKDPAQFQQITASLEILREAWQDAFEQLKREGHFAESTAQEAQYHAIESGRSGI